jgi:hypothetical protein
VIDRRQFLTVAGAAGALVASRPFPAVAASDPSRVALVVGNNAYPQSPLNNAINDARAVGELLGSAGFTVDLRIDAKLEELAKAVEAFGASLARSETKLAFFYYAGHGTQVDWRNFLVPVDANVASAAELASRCFDLGVLLGQMSKSRDKVFVVILDACRDNPFGTAFRPASRGLSPFDAPAGTVLAFSTAPGAVASDGPGKHGLYSESLVRELAVRGVRIEDAFKRVRLNVRVASQGQQIPWESTSLESDVFLFPEAKKLSESELERRFEQELATWNRIKLSKKTDDWVAYLREYPNGKFSEIAQTRLNALMPVVERSEAVAPAAGGAKFFELGAGRPMPDFYGAQKNPHSAGIYPLGRRYTVGDEATLEWLDPISKVRQAVRNARVTKVDVDADRVELNDGFVVMDLMGNTFRMGSSTWDPVAQNYPAELQIGRKWAARFRRTHGGWVADIALDYQVLRRERVVVPAGDFDTFLIEGRGYARHPRGLSRAEVRIWVVPGLNWNVRFERLADGGRSDGEIVQLISAKQHL